MAKGRKKSKSRLQAELQELRVKKRNALIQMFGAIALVIVVMILKTAFEGYGFEWATNFYVNMAFYLFMVVMAAVAGLGGRRWSKSRHQEDDILVQLNR